MAEQEKTQTDVNYSDSKKKQKKRLVLHIICAVGVLTLIVIALFTLGWFTNNKATEVDGANGQAVSGNFELAAVGTAGKYDNYLNASDGKILSDVTDEDGNTLENLVGTENASEIKWVMSNDSNFENNQENESEGIQPGSHGKLTFYVIPQKNMNLDLKISLNTILYDNNVEEITETNNNQSHIISDEQPCTKLVKGHILFFRKYNEASKIYSDRIDGDFTYTKQSAKANTAYKIDIYWVWPNVVDELVLPTDDVKFTNGQNRIIGDAVTDKIVKTDDENFGYFFADSYKEKIKDTTITSVEKGSNDANFSDNYNILTEAWNNADQIIGLNVGYIELDLTVNDTPAQTTAG